MSWWLDDANWKGRIVQEMDGINKDLTSIEDEISVAHERIDEVNDEISKLQKRLVEVEKELGKRITESEKEIIKAEEKAKTTVETIRSEIKDAQLMFYLKVGGIGGGSGIGAGVITTLVIKLITGGF